MKGLSCSATWNAHIQKIKFTRDQVQYPLRLMSFPFVAHYSSVHTYQQRVRPRPADDGFFRDISGFSDLSFGRLCDRSTGTGLPALV